jgi:hypothetical protein
MERERVVVGRGWEARAVQLKTVRRIVSWSLISRMILGGVRIKVLDDVI